MARKSKSIGHQAQTDEKRRDDRYDAHAVDEPCPNCGTSPRIQTLWVGGSWCTKCKSYFGMQEVAA